ncbi:MAG: hypothetical protein ABFR97_09610 [Thermodesulfobacteriota bacterium]
MKEDSVTGYSVTNIKVKIHLTNGEEYLGTLNTRTTKKVSKFFIEELAGTDFFVLTKVVRHGDNDRFDVMVFNKNHVLHIEPMAV